VDNADLRLTPKGREWGLVDDERWDYFCRRRARFEGNISRLREAGAQDARGARIPAERWLKQSQARLGDLVSNGFELEQPAGRLDAQTLETTVKYQGYLKRQEAEVARRARDEHRSIPVTFAYRNVPGLSAEVVQRLSQVRPETLGQARRVPGVTPAAIAVLATYVCRSS
jgi:tRNA uridine 5-carboxymethylaminomethyl modification enzyme